MHLKRLTLVSFIRIPYEFLFSFVVPFFGSLNILTFSLFSLCELVLDETTIDRILGELAVNQVDLLMELDY